MSFYMTNETLLHTPLGQAAASMGKCMPENHSPDVLGTSSPFACMEGQNYHYAPVPKNTSDSEAWFLIENRIVGNLDFSILLIISQFEFVTSRQINDLLVMDGIEVSSKTLHHVLRRAVKKSFISRIEFSYPGGKIQGTKAYTLNYHGIKFLYSSGVLTRSLKYYRSLNAVDIKRQLASNQLLIPILRQSPTNYQIRSILVHRGFEGHIVRVNAMFTCENGTYLVEVVRRSENWQEAFSSKLQRYAAVLEYHHSLQEPIEDMPTLIMMGEDLDHLHELQALVQHTEINRYPHLFTHDKLFYVQAEKLFFQGVA